MKIAIDYREAIREKKAGKGWYVWHVVRELKEIIKDDEVYLYVDRDFEDDLPKNWHKVIIDLPEYLWHLAAWWKMGWNVDVYFSPTSFWVPWLDWSGRCVIVVHDLVAFHDELSKRHSWKAKWFEKITLKGAIDNATKIIVPSEATKKDLIDIFNVAEKKIVMVWEGMEEKSKVKGQKSKELEDVKEKFGITGEYIFFVSTLESRKNLENLVKAFAVVRKTWQGRLVLAGKKGWYFEGLFALVRELGLEEEVIFTGYIDDEEKYILMAGARCFCYISLYEGFGLPILEAMSVGTPVVTSNVSCLPEIAGGEAVLVDPKNIDDIAGGISRVLSDIDLIKELIKKGDERVKTFSWKNAAEEIYRVIANKR